MEYQKTRKDLDKQLWFKLDTATHERLMEIALNKERSVAYVLRKLVEDFVLRKIDIEW